VVATIKEKKRLMDAGETHDHLKILCICDGGLIKGAYSVGVGMALEELGYTDVFTDLVGVSSGAVSVAYYLGGNTYEGGTLIYDECCSRRFLNPWHFWAPADTQYIVDVMRGFTGKALNFNEIFASRTKLHIGVSDFETATPKLMRPLSKDELLETIHASILLPSVAKGKVFLKTRRYFDGGVSYPHIIQEAVSTIDFTHVLILTSQNYNEEKVSKLERLICSTVFRHRMSKMGRQAFGRRRQARREALDKLLARNDVASLLVWGDGTISGTERDGSKVRAVVERSKKWWLEIMNEN
jgi:predicted patatin/cPLA2 family phospholipase